MNTRAQRLVAQMPRGFEAALIDRPVSRQYLLNFDADEAGTLLLLPDGMVYLIDSRYIEAASESISQAQVLLEKDAAEQLAELFTSKKIGRVFLENQIAVSRWQSLKNKMPSVEFVVDSTLSDELAALRMCKDDEELASMRKAQQITDACFSHILPFIKEGVTETELMLEMEYFVRTHGAQKMAFDTICVAGKKTSMPHGKPDDNRVQAGDFITMDFGAKVNGYCADMTRTVAFGEPDKEKRELYAVVLRAHQEAMAAVKAGKMACDVDAVARQIIDEAGYQGCFGHGLGHAVGLEIHESPRFSPKCRDRIKAGMVMTVEPGIYLAGRFGCRIEDTVLVTPTGCESLATSPKELLIL